MPCDIQRRMTDLSDAKKWKMRTNRLFVTYIAYPALRYFSSAMRSYGSFLTTQSQLLFHSLRLVGGFSVLPVPDWKLDKAERILDKYFSKTVSAFGEEAASYTLHNSKHVVHDAREFGCHIDNNGVYNCESYHQRYKRLLKNGPKPYKQIL